MCGFITNILTYNGRQIDEKEIIKVSESDFVSLNQSSIDSRVKVINVSNYTDEIKPYFDKIFNETSVEMIITGNEINPGFFTKDGESINMPVPFGMKEVHSYPGYFDDLLRSLKPEEAQINVLSASVAFFIRYCTLKDKSGIITDTELSKEVFDYCVSNYDSFSVFRKNDYKRVNKKLVSGLLSNLRNYNDSGLANAYCHVVDNIAGLGYISGGIPVRNYGDETKEYLKESRNILVPSCISVETVCDLLPLISNQSCVYIVRDVTCSDDVLFNTAKIFAYLEGHDKVFFEDRSIFDVVNFPKIDTIVLPRLISEIKQDLACEYLLRSYEFLEDHGKMMAFVPFNFLASEKGLEQRKKILEKMQLVKIINWPGNKVDYECISTSVLFFEKSNHGDTVEVFRGNPTCKRESSHKKSSFDKSISPEAWVYERLPISGKKTTAGYEFVIRETNNCFRSLYDVDSLGGKEVLAIDRDDPSKLKRYKAKYSDTGDCERISSSAVALLVHDNNLYHCSTRNFEIVEKGVYIIEYYCHDLETDEEIDDFIDWVYYCIYEYIIPTIRKALKSGIVVDLDFIKAIEIPVYEYSKGMGYTDTREPKELFDEPNEMLDLLDSLDGKMFDFTTRDHLAIIRSESIGDCSKLTSLFRDLREIEVLYNAFKNLVSMNNVALTDGNKEQMMELKEKITDLTHLMQERASILSDGVKSRMGDSLNEKSFLKKPEKITSMLGDIYIELENEIYDIVGRRSIL